MAAILNSNMAAHWYKICDLDCHRWIPCLPKHTFRHQNRVNSSISAKDNKKCRFQMAAILNSNMAAHWHKLCNADCYHWIPYPKKHTFRHQNQINSNIRLKDNQKCRFQMAAILNSNMAAHGYKICDADCYHWIPCPKKHTFRHQN